MMRSATTSGEFCYSPPRHPELFATTVSLLNSAISLPPSEEASLNPGEFELQLRPSSSGFFLPVSSGVNNPAARAFRNRAAARATALADADADAAAADADADADADAAAAAAAKKRKNGKMLRMASMLVKGGNESKERVKAKAGKDITAAPALSAKKTEKKIVAHHSTQLLDPLGVAVAMDKFDRDDISFGVKTGDLLVSPLGRTVEMVGVGLMHRAAMAPNGMIHMSAPIPVPFVDFKTKAGWSKRRTTRADLVGYRRGHGLAPMESELRMDEFTLKEDGKEAATRRTATEITNDDPDAAKNGWLEDDGGDEDDDGAGLGTTDASGFYRPRYKPAPEHVGIAQRAREMEASREDRVERRREAEAQWRAARGKESLEEENRLAAWAGRIRDAHEAQMSAGCDQFQRGYLAPRGGIARGPKPVVAASATRAYGGMKPLNEILPRPALDQAQAHWSLNRPAAMGEYTPMGSANRMSLI